MRHSHAEGKDERHMQQRLREIIQERAAGRKRTLVHFRHLRMIRAAGLERWIIPYGGQLPQYK